MAIEAVFFDVGQTLVHPVPDGAGFSQVAVPFGFEITAEAILANNGKMYARYNEHYQRDPGFWDNHESARAVWLDAYTLLYQLLETGDKAEELAAEAYNFYFNPGAWFAYDDVQDGLEQLAQSGLKLGLISNWDSSLIPVIKSIGLDHYFLAMISSADVGMHKPDKDIFEYAIQQLGVLPDEAIHIGDHLTADVQGALDAGLHAVYMDRYNSHPEFDLAPRLESLRLLPALIENLNT
ncbi:MAG: HAD-IA family hydrolase [Coriobacteriia bacterium]|nr:HAD-IA family hydrolase [Coriobacteriia bacterium]